MSSNKYYLDEENRRSFELPGAKPHYNPDRPGQVERIFLDIVLDIPKKTLQGTCNITIKPVRPGIKQLTLDAVDLNIESVLIDNVSQPFDYDGEKLQVSLLNPSSHNPITLAIAYKVSHPQRGIYFITPTEDYPHKPTQVWTQGEDEDSRYWFPCFDYPGQLAVSEIRVKVPKPMMAISNGKLISTKELDQDIIYHWLQEEIHPTYLMTLAVGDFAEIKDSYQDIPINYYVEKGREEDGLRSMGKTPKMVEFFSKKFGYPYPYPKYYQVCVDDFIFGGMENTSTTILTDRCLLDATAANDQNSTETLVAHELAHQWFGDLVVIKHWSHAWIKEGMASYSEVLWQEYEYTQEDAAYYLLKEAQSYLEEDKSRYRRPIVTNVYREAIELYDRHLYEKGACVYHMIRTILGDELFERAIHTFVNNNAHKTVETVDLLRAIEQATGYNLMFLFDQYVFRGGHPDFKISYSWDGDGNLAKLTVTQTQAKDSEDRSMLFELTIPVAFNYLDGDKVTQKTFPLKLTQKEQAFYFPLETKPAFVSFDVGNNYLKTVSLEYPVAELKAQLKYDSDCVSRIYAAKALAKKGGLEAIAALSESLQKDSFWGMRVEAAKALATIKLDQAAEALTASLTQENPKVRRAVIEGLSSFKTEKTYQTLKELHLKGDVSYYIQASLARGLAGVISGNLKDKEDEVINILHDILLTKAGWNEVVRSGAIGGLASLKTSPKAVDIILEYTKLGTPQALRLAAIRSLGAVSGGQTPEKLDLILQNLEAISTESFYLTQVAVCVALGQIKNSEAIGILSTLAAQTPDGRVRRVAEEAIGRVQKNLGSDKAVTDLREALDKLKQENQDLKSRVAKLEAK